MEQTKQSTNDIYVPAGHCNEGPVVTLNGNQYVCVSSLAAARDSITSTQVVMGGGATGSKQQNTDTLGLLNSFVWPAIVAVLVFFVLATIRD